MSCGGRPTCSPTSSPCKARSAAIRPSARRASLADRARSASPATTRRNSCSGRRLPFAPAPAPPRTRTPSNRSFRRRVVLSRERLDFPGPRVMPEPSAKPGRDCPRCPRLAAFRDTWRAKEPGWFNAPVPSFGPLDARLLIVGLAPGLQGANRTGRPFTGDYAGDLLYATLGEFGFSRGKYEERPDDSLRLRNCRISNAVRCVPPQNKPLPAEIRTCRDFLAATIEAMPRLCAIVALGRVAHDSLLKVLK